MSPPPLIRSGLAAAAVLLLASASLQAQQESRPRGRGGFFSYGGPARFLASPQVQDELKLSDEQRQNVQARFDRAREEFRELFRSEDLTRQERRERARRLQESSHSEVLAILDDAQKKRLREIELQQLGYAALAYPESGQELSNQLDLSEEQQQQIRQAVEANNDSRRELFQQGFGGDGPDRGREVFQKLSDLRQALNEKIEVVLTAEQKSEWKKMLGEPFHFSRDSDRPRRRGSPRSTEGSE